VPSIMEHIATRYILAVVIDHPPSSRKSGIDPYVNHFLPFRSKWSQRCKTNRSCDVGFFCLSKMRWHSLSLWPVHSKHTRRSSIGSRSRSNMRPAKSSACTSVNPSAMNLALRRMTSWSSCSVTIVSLLDVQSMRCHAILCQMLNATSQTM